MDLNIYKKRKVYEYKKQLHSKIAALLSVVISGNALLWVALFILKSATQRRPLSVAGQALGFRALYVPGKMMSYFDCRDVWLWHTACFVGMREGALSTCSATACPGAAWSSPSQSPAWSHWHLHRPGQSAARAITAELKQQQQQRGGNASIATQEAPHGLCYAASRGGQL
eukprot:422647-Pelagomonas_calceolata.AAC.2